MPSSLLDAVSQMVGRQRITEMAASMGEREDSVRRGMEAGSTALLSQIAARSRERGFMQRIFDLVQGTDGNLEATPYGSMGNRVVGLAFGGNQSGVSEALARAVGVRSSAAANILEYAAAPAVIGALGSRVREGGLTMNALQAMLTSELPSIGAMLPAGLKSFLTVPAQAIGSVTTAAQSASRDSRRWLVPLLIALLLGAGIWWMIARKRGPVDSGVIGSQSQGTVGPFFDTKLPNGISLHIPRNGMENRLIAFIQDGSQAASRDASFDFDRLRFDKNSATLRPESHEQTYNIAEILKAYPNVYITIGGYTDNVGNSEDNLRLSQARAENVMGDLVAAGIAPNRLHAEGYGDRFPVADNATPDGRARNRRISLRVMRK